MPLYKVINPDKKTTLFIWKITETYNDLIFNLDLTPNSMLRLLKMKSTVHQLGFLAVRKLLETANYSDSDLFYDDSGKPHLVDKKCISISHSHQFATIIISENSVGIDIEMQQEKIIHIANKFINDKEVSLFDKNIKTEYIKKLTIIWGAKEVVFKIVNQVGISFKNHIWVDEIDLNDKEGTLILSKDELNKRFKAYFIEIEEFILVYGWLC